MVGGGGVAEPVGERAEVLGAALDLERSRERHGGEGGGHKLRVLYITGHWLDVDNLDDLSKAQSFQAA